MGRCAVSPTHPSAGTDVKSTCVRSLPLSAATRCTLWSTDDLSPHSLGLSYTRKHTLMIAQSIKKITNKYKYLHVLLYALFLYIIWGENRYKIFFENVILFQFPPKIMAFIIIIIIRPRTYFIFNRLKCLKMRIVLSVMSTVKWKY